MSGTLLGGTIDVIPGQSLGSELEYESGVGTYVRAGNIYASIVGRLSSSAAAEGGGVGSSAASSSSSSSSPASASTSSSIKPALVVIRSRSSDGTPLVPKLGSVVIGRVVRISHIAANLEIFVVDDRSVVEPFNGVLRKENVRETEVDSVIIADTCRPGDIVKAVVLSMGDTHSYVCGTARIDLGVIYARDEVSGKMLVPASYDEMVNIDNGRTEKRKVAKPA